MNIRSVVVSILAMLAVSAGATTFTVDWKTGDDVAAAADPTRATPFATITAAVALAADGDVVQVKPGTYDAGVVIGQAITLEATSSDPADTVIDGKGEAICVACNSAGAIVKGFTLCNGFGAGGGFCAAENFAAGGTLVDSVVTGCSGGGVGTAVRGGRAVRCRITNNVEGAVYGSILVNCVISGTTYPDGTSNGFPCFGLRLQLHGC